ncbi:PilZ domain-containing protein [Caldichromatium japonicum]|uniref:PilZ domain-containing protein n=1 Tax=Caldichromatium japonicum TaxID=2699430 RepID=A0A6G7VDU0_9GAMM|nr:PilZ domain-containing protein [Caldichromatium japonicum]QIK38209.1 PilZ domain-containing protein [Caldichromatium japonicum]
MERRTQRRIELRIPVELILPDHKQIHAITRDLSWGGALVQLSEPIQVEVKTLMIILPWSKGKSIRAQAQILRREPLDQSDSLIALRFTSLSPRNQNRLERLLQMLLRHDTKAPQESVPLFRDLEVIVSDPEELRQIFMQLIEGRYTATVFESYEVGQSIRLSIVPNLELPDLHLRARVIGVEKVDLKGYNWTELYNLSLLLEHPKRAIRDFINLVLRQISESESGLSTFSTLSRAPDWLCSVAGAINRALDDNDTSSNLTSYLSEETAQQSYLESEFPEVIQRLIAAWGDVEGFDQIFSRLLLDNCNLPNGWPRHVWAELEFLQELHDLAFGLPERRRGPSKGGRA